VSLSTGATEEVVAGWRSLVVHISCPFIMVMNATFNYRLTVSRSPIANKAAWFNSPASRGVCQSGGAMNGHHTLKADLDGLERQYLTLVEFVILFLPPSSFHSLAITQHKSLVYRVETTAGPARTEGGPLQSMGCLAGNVEKIGRTTATAA